MKQYEGSAKSFQKQNISIEYKEAMQEDFGHEQKTKKNKGKLDAMKQYEESAKTFQEQNMHFFFSNVQTFLLCHIFRKIQKFQI